MRRAHQYRYEHRSHPGLDQWFALPGTVCPGHRAQLDISEVSADKAYLSRRNLAVVNEVGGAPYIPFKIDSVSHGEHEGL